MRVLIIGAGAVGCAISEELGARGIPVRFLMRPGAHPVSLPGAPALRTVVFEGVRGPKTLTLEPATDEYLARVDLAIVAVKAFELEQALANATRLPPSAVIIPVGNGAVWDIVRHAARGAPHCQWRFGFLTFGITEVSAGHYALKSRDGEVSFGPLAPGVKPTAAEQQLLMPSGFFGWHDNIELLARRKWIYNTVINSLTAARRLPCNGDLLADLPTLAAVFNEALTLATDLWGPLPLDAHTLYAGLIQLIERTRTNENSMARDRRLGRRTESEFLAGLARDAQRYPLLSGLHQTIWPVEK